MRYLVIGLLALTVAFLAGLQATNWALAAELSLAWGALVFGVVATLSFPVWLWLYMRQGDVRHDAEGPQPVGGPRPARHPAIARHPHSPGDGPPDRPWMRSPQGVGR